jgi:hypothetical protein
MDVKPGKDFIFSEPLDPGRFEQLVELSGTLTVPMESKYSSSRRFEVRTNDSDQSRVTAGVQRPDTEAMYAVLARLL